MASNPWRLPTDNPWWPAPADVATEYAIRRAELAEAKLAVAEKALEEIEAAEPQSIGTREVHDGEAWKQAEYFEPFEFRHARRIARAALAELRGDADA